MKVGDIVVDKNGIICKVIDDSVFNLVKVQLIKAKLIYDVENPEQFESIRIPKEWFRLATEKEIAEIIAEKLLN